MGRTTKSDEPQSTAVPNHSDRVNELDVYVAQVGALNAHLDVLSDSEYARLCQITDVGDKTPAQIRAYTAELGAMCDAASWRTERPKSARSRAQRIEDIFSLLPNVHQRREGATRLYKELQPELERLVQEELDAEKAPAPSRIEQLKLALNRMKAK